MKLVCAFAREAASARLDGEDLFVDEETLDSHLASCRSCAFFEAEAIQIKRWMLIGPVN